MPVAQFFIWPNISIFESRLIKPRSRTSGWLNIILHVHPYSRITNLLYEKIENGKNNAPFRWSLVIEIQYRQLWASDVPHATMQMYKWQQNNLWSSFIRASGSNRVASAYWPDNVRFRIDINAISRASLATSPDKIGPLTKWSVCKRWQLRFYIPLCVKWKRYSISLHVSSSRRCTYISSLALGQETRSYPLSNLRFDIDLPLLLRFGSKRSP